MNRPDELALYSEWLQNGVAAATTREETLTLARILLREPAYTDAKHRWHDAVKEDVKALYEAANPEPQPISARYKDQAAQRAQQLLQEPAYQDHAHKDHARVVAEARQAYENANRPVVD
jgi:phospholipase C